MLQYACVRSFINTKHKTRNMITITIMTTMTIMATVTNTILHKYARVRNSERVPTQQHTQTHARARTPAVPRLYPHRTQCALAYAGVERTPRGMMSHAHNAMPANRCVCMMYEARACAYGVRLCVCVCVRVYVHVGRYVLRHIVRLTRIRQTHTEQACCNTHVCAVS